MTPAKVALSRAARAAIAITVLGLVLRIVAWPCAPDTWDGVGFVEAVTSFDLASFRPHPPGYPLYVALARLVNACGAPPLHAVVAATCMLGACAPLAGYAIVARLTEGNDRGGALFTVAMLAGAPGLVVSSVATLSDGAGLALALAAYACALDGRARAPLYTGLLAAAAVGVRPADLLVAAPAVLVLAHRHGVGGVVRGVVAAAVGCVAWALPTALIVGPHRWLDLTREHLTGHLAHFGERDAVWTQGRSAARAFFEAIGLQTFGLEETAGFALGVVIVVAVVIALLACAVRSGRRALFVALAVPVPFAFAIAWTQPIAAAPRHALPVTAALIVLAGVALSFAGARAPRALAVVSVLAASVAGVIAARVHRQPPAAVAMLRSVAHEPSLAHAAVVGGRSSRFADYGEGARVAPGELAGDAVIFATRASPLPQPLLLTDELDLRGVPPDRLHDIATFTRASPLDRRERTIRLLRFELTMPR